MNGYSELNQRHFKMININHFYVVYSLHMSTLRGWSRQVNDQARFTSLIDIHVRKQPV